MKEKVLNVIFILFGLFMTNSGLIKLTHYISMGQPSQELQEVFNLLVEIGWIMPLLGVVELLGGVLVVIPKYRLLGAIMLLPVLTGILLTHIVNDPSILPMAIGLFVVNLLILLLSRNKICELIK